jgi:UDP-N-acetylglucosamine 2-epimerase (non-hydrolysing)
MEKEKPDALLILGDTNSALCSISAKRLKIPVFHMEAGNRCFDENLPEEINRRIIDHISDVNLPYTEHARRYLYAEGIAKERIFVTGSPMTEVLKAHKDEIEASGVLKDFGLEPGKYILLSAHREENIDIEKNFFQLMDAVNRMAEFYRMPVVYSLHPRSEKFIKARGFRFHENVRLIKPFGFFDYNCLQKNALCVVSDSGTLAEESAILNFPAVSIRTSTERPEAVEKACFVLGNITAEQVLQAVELAVSMYRNGDCGMPVPDYADENVSAKVIKTIQSYTEIVNQTIWKKQI